MKQSEEETRKRFNFLKHYYDNTWDPQNHTLHVGVFHKPHSSLPRAYTDATTYLIKKIDTIRPITSDARILDIGCGAGRTLIALCDKYNAQGVGVDLSDEMIRDAKKELAQVNARRVKMGASKLRIRFIQGSGSDLKRVFKKDEQFTHIISQDAIFLMQNKKAVFENVMRLLVPSGAVGIADFLSEAPKQKLTKKEEQAIYSFVHWKQELSYKQYQDILQNVGFSNVICEQRDADMIHTYELLIKQIKKHPHEKDEVLQELVNRYQHIVDGVTQGRMGWGLFWAQKPHRKRALIAGTNPKSIGRYIAKELHSRGWEIWLYGRHSKIINKPYWHERRCNIAKEKDIDRLLQEIPDVDLVLFLADTGAHGPLEELEAKQIAPFIDAKMIGSLLLSKELIQRDAKRTEPMQFVWCAGKPVIKPKHLIAYSIVNSGLWGFVQELNAHYSNQLDAYYLPTPLISPSTLGDEYIKRVGKQSKKQSYPPKIIADTVLQIVEKKHKPGMIKLQQNVL